jgi:hypothetical protein
MNQSRRTFFKRLGMLAAMPFLAKFLPNTPDVTVGNSHLYVGDWSNTNVSNDLTYQSLDDALEAVRDNRAMINRLPHTIYVKPEDLEQCKRIIGK